MAVLFFALLGTAKKFDTELFLWMGLLGGGILAEPKMMSVARKRFFDDA
jgi:hypothetical protein